jgi:hypothetical protein
MLSDFDIPMDVTRLILCRCVDCKGHDRTPTCPIQLAFDEGSASDLPIEEAWHYCANYDGPFEPADVWLFPAPSKPSRTAPPDAARY